MRLLVLFGPPAVGKMTVGRAIVTRSAFRLCHNHALMEPLLEVFEFGSPPFQRLLGRWRRELIEEAAAAGADLALTFAWALELEEDTHEVGDYVRPYLSRGASLAFVELYADLGIRLERNRTEHRLREKRSKRDVTWSDANLRDLERHVLSTAPGEPARTPGERMLAEHRHLRLDTSDLTADQAAVASLRWLDG